MAKKRLIKVAKELNVGITTIVDHLKASGFDLESKPTAQVTDEMYAELNKEFKSSIAIKEKADQLIIGTRPIAKREKDPVKMPPIPKPKVVAPPPPPPPIVRKKEEPVVAKKATPPSTTPKLSPKSESTPTSKLSSTPGKLKILGKIDLDKRTSSGKYKKPKIEQKAPAPQPPKEEAPKVPVIPPKVEPKVQTPSVKVEKPKEIAPVVVVPKVEEKVVQKAEPTPPVVTKKPEVVVPVVKKEPLPKAEPKEVKAAPIEVKQVKVAPTSALPKKEEKPVVKLASEATPEPVKNQEKEPKKIEKKEEQREQKAKTTPKLDKNPKHKIEKNKKPKQEKIKAKKQEEAKTGEKAPKEATSAPTPVQNTMVRAETPELRGLKIVGKIDTNQFKRKRKKRRRDDKKDDNRAKVTKDGTKSSENKENQENKEDGENRRKRRRTRKKVLTEGSSNQSGRNRDTNNRSGERGTNRTGDDRNNRGGGERTRTVRPGGNDRGTSRTGGGGNDRGTSRTGGGGNDRGTSRTGGGGNDRGTSRTSGGGNDRGTSRTGGGSNDRGTSRTGGGNRGGNNRGDRSRRTRDRNHRGRSDRGGRRDEVKEVSQKEIDDKIKATMARISGRGNKKRSRVRRENRERIRDKQELREQEKTTDKLQVTEFISVSELASLMDVAVTDVIMTCMNLGVIVSINQRLDAEIIELVGEEYGHEVEFISVEEHVDEEEEIVDDPADLRPRSPIVTVMGHVDHGKTSLLDYIRDANVADGEAGGITQHIGAYEVKVGEEKKPITFLDTPGHEAFTAMRARGAKVTDIAVIIISADDSIMPQTREAISHAQAASVPMVFAINKIDKDGAQPERIKQELASMNLMVEDWGGKYQSQDISAKTGLNIDLLLEKILLEAELLELKANPSRAAIGAVLEASLDKGRGYVAKTLVQTGTLKIGDPIVAGEHSGKVKAMFNERGKRVKKAGPSTPVLVLGLGGAPQAGELFKVVDSEQDARAIASKRAQIAREQANRATKRISLDELGRRIALGTFKELNLIVKGDVDGSIEALSDSLIKLSVETVQVNVIHKAVGQIIESDVLLASASDAIIIGFQVRPSLGARKLAEREGVEINTYSVIYDVIDEIKTAMEGMLEPTKEKKVTGNVEIREVYKISKIGNIAGCYVLDGKISRNSHVSVIRDGIVKYPVKEGAHGELASLKRYKDDVKEVKFGMECGLTIKNFNDIKVGDVVEAYDIIEIKQTLSSQKKR